MGSQIICMSLLEKAADYVIYEFGNSMKDLDGKMKLSLRNPREEFVILEESQIGPMETLRAHSKLARVIEQGETPEKVCRAS